MWYVNVREVHNICLFVSFHNVLSNYTITVGSDLSDVYLSGSPDSSDGRLNGIATFYCIDTFLCDISFEGTDDVR